MALPIVRGPATGSCGNAQDARVEVRAYFDPPMHRVTPFAGFAARRETSRSTESLSERIIGLPMANDISQRVAGAPPQPRARVAVTAGPPTASGIAS